MSLNTPLKTARGLGSAKSGTEHFWLERVTSIASLPLVLFALYFIVSRLGATRAEMVASLDNPFVALMLVLAVISIFWHMKLGMQVIIEDYVQGHAMKIAMLLLNTFYTVALGAAALYAILRMNLGL
jgi:succinate dehydrogenase / fumarate reductase membrane anchor subunit